MATQLVASRAVFSSTYGLVFLCSVLQLLVNAKVVPSYLVLFLYVIPLRSVLMLLVTANVVPSSLIVLSLMMEAILSFETSVLTLEDDILHSHHCENRKPYINLRVSTVLKYPCNTNGRTQITHKECRLLG
jgi:hypothetical protein